MSSCTYLARHQERDLRTIVDRLAESAPEVPVIDERIVLDRIAVAIAVAGHNWGTQTALIGARYSGSGDNSTYDNRNPRVSRASGSLSLRQAAPTQNRTTPDAFHSMHADFFQMAPPALGVAAEYDDGAARIRGPDWWRQAYGLGPGTKALFIANHAKHSLGGIATYEAVETTEECPPRVAAIRRLSTAWLHLGMSEDEAIWLSASTSEASVAQGTIETKSH